ncbi:MAG: hypothetical protein HY567_03015 [Candidatus Kerfeldbacteria bacterium]|nr:hypothetical protein [Candidatus Kerfeldbacteria bacterium]
MKRVLMLVILAALAAGCGKSFKSATTPQVATVTGKLFGVVKIDRSGIPLDARPELLWSFGENKLPIGSMWLEVTADSAQYIFRRTYPTDSLRITIGGQPVTIHPDGTFEAVNVPPGEQELIFYIRGEPVRTQTVSIGGHSQDLTLEIERVIDTCCPKKPEAVPHSVSETFPCLDNNGIWPAGFLYSDCFMSLFAGPPWYSWMCWSEAMNVIHDHHGNIWCNGTHNCSLFVHGWYWDAQRWHRHYTAWWPQW